MDAKYGVKVALEFYTKNKRGQLTPVKRTKFNVFQNFSETKFGWKSRNGGVIRETSGTPGDPFSSVSSGSTMDISSTDFSRTHGGVNSEIREEFKIENQNVSNAAGGSASRLKVEKNQIKLNYASKPVKTQYKCYVCGEKIKGKDKLVLHLKNHMGANQYECDECGHKFKELRYLKKHLLQTTAKDNGYSFKCSYCSHTFMLKSSCRNHERVHFQTEEPCCLCELRFPDIKQLKDHVQTVHRKEKYFKCSLCGNGYSCASHLQRHIKQVSGDFPHKCLTCGHRYSSELGLRRHEYHHGKIKSVVCLFCLEMFTNKTHLARHLDRRGKLKQYQCKGCERKFATSKYLIKHLETYNADRPFRCSKCGHTFMSQGLLVSHMKVHTGESWRCMSCGDVFKKKVFLDTHLQIHSKGFTSIKGNHGKKQDHNQNFCQPELPDSAWLKSRTSSITEELRSGSCAKLCKRSSLLKTETLRHSPMTPCSQQHYLLEQAGCDVRPGHPYSQSVNVSRHSTQDIYLCHQSHQNISGDYVDVEGFYDNQLGNL